jgi:hypothetical protein
VGRLDFFRKSVGSLSGCFYRQNTDTKKTAGNTVITLVLMYHQERELDATCCNGARQLKIMCCRRYRSAAAAAAATPVLPPVPRRNT